jgi:leader peptidase (prepilin peptidase)/N-methyltransferase
MPYSLSGNGLFYSDPIYTGLLSFFIFCVGVCMGSFASAISYRTIRRESWIVSHSCYSAARSRCPQCDHPLGVLDLIPVLSWIFLGGKCRYCRKSISCLYPALEFLSAIILLAYFLFVGYQQTLAQNVLFVVFLPFFIAFIGSLFQKVHDRPSSLWIMGLLSTCGMIILFLI